MLRNPAVNDSRSDQVRSSRDGSVPPRSQGMKMSGTTIAVPATSVMTNTVE
jgi:hypothetical protein